MLQPIDASDGRRLYEFFREANYTAQGLTEIFGTVELPSQQLRNLPRMLYKTQERCLLHTLLRWFVMGLPVDEKTARELVPEPVLRLLVDTGMLVAGGTNLSAGILMTPLATLLVASDTAARLESRSHPDLVLAIHPAARSLLCFTIRRPVAAALDLGTGCGIQALAAAAHSKQVVATDLNPRATAFAAFNARLNGFENIQCLTGDSFAPVRERTFDLIVTNPPFMIVPTHRYLYRDSGLELDRFCRLLVRQACRLMKEGGFFQMICEWVEVKGETWQERLSGWFEGAECDAWVVKNYTKEPSIYARDRIRETEPDSGNDEAIYSEWMRHYERNSVRAIHGGLIAMRRRSGRNWVCVEELPASAEESFGNSVLERFEARDFLEAHTSDERMLKVKLKMSPKAWLHSPYRWSEKGWEPMPMELRLRGGLPHSVHLDSSVADFLGRCDGSLSIEELMRGLELKAGIDAGEFRAECLRLLRKLIQHGFLLPQASQLSVGRSGAPA